MIGVLAWLVLAGLTFYTGLIWALSASKGAGLTCLALIVMTGIVWFSL